MENKSHDKNLEKTIPHEMQLDVYLNRLTEIDQSNLYTTGSRFQRTMRTLNKHGALLVVGGTVRNEFTKEEPRKDIDIVMIIEDEQISDANKSLFQKTEDMFQVFSQIIEKMQAEDDQFPTIRFENISIIAPYPDPEFEFMPDREGSITLKPPSGMPLEFINRIPRRTVDDELQLERYPEMGKQGRPFVLLTRV